MEMRLSFRIQSFIQVRKDFRQNVNEGEMFVENSLIHSFIHSFKLKALKIHTCKKGLSEVETGNPKYVRRVTSINPIYVIWKRNQFNYSISPFNYGMKRRLIFLMRLESRECITQSNTKPY